MIFLEMIDAGRREFSELSVLEEREREKMLMFCALGSRMLDRSGLDADWAIGEALTYWLLREVFSRGWVVEISDDTEETLHTTLKGALSQAFGSGECVVYLYSSEKTDEETYIGSLSLNLVNGTSTIVDHSCNSTMSDLVDLIQKDFPH